MAAIGRQEEERHCRNPRLLKSVQVQHEKDRKEKRAYLRILKYDQEILFLKKFAEYDLLW